MKPLNLKLLKQTITAKTLLFILLYSSCNIHKTADEELTAINDTIKIRALLNKENSVSTRLPDSAIKYNQQAIHLSHKIKYPDGYINGYLNLGRVYLFQANYDSSLICLNKALNYAKSESLNKYIAVSLGLIGLNHEEQSHYSQSIDYYLETEKIFESLHDSANMVKCYVNISNVYRKIGDRTKALNYILEGLELAEKTNNDNNRGLCLNNLSILYQDIGENKIALPFFFQSLEISKKFNDSIGMAHVLNNIGVCYFGINEYDMALQYYQEALEIKERLKKKSEIAGTLVNIGNLKMAFHDYQSAHHYFSKALKLSIADKNELLTSKLYRNLGEVFTELNKNDSALICLKKSLDIAQKYGMNERIHNSLTLLTSIYGNMGDYKNAFYSSQKLSAFNDTILKLRNSVKIEEIKAQFEVEKKEEQILKLNKEKEQAKRFKLFIIIFTCFLILAFIYVFFSSRSRIKKNKEIAAYQQSLVERKLTISQLKQTNLEQSLKYSEKEMVNLALYLVQKTEFVDTLRKEISSLQRKKAITKEEALKNLTKLIAASLRIDKEQVEFQVQLENLNKGFYKKLQDKFPDLTKNELKLSALLRQNFSSKEIASIYNISPTSVDMNRYRLRKKLNLKSEENLTDFLSNI